MEILQILVTSIFGTIVMTAFSYYVSERFNELFKEPVLLNLVTASAKVDLNPRRKSALGWIIHFTIGLLFVICYHVIWKYTDFDPTWFCGLIFGMVSGLIGIVSWHFMFKLGEHPPKIKFKEYYLQLFIAHILFGLTAVACYKIIMQLAAHQ